MQGDVLVQRTVGHNHAGGVGAGVAHHPFQATRCVDQLLDFRVGGIKLLEFGNRLGRIVAQYVAELGRFGPAGHQPGDPVDVRLLHVQGAAHITDGCLGAERPERDDRGDFVLTVLVRGIGDHLCPAVIREVQVDIGHGHAARIEEALEDQTVA